MTLSRFEVLMMITSTRTQDPRLAGSLARRRAEPLARIFHTRGGEKYGNTHIVHVHRGVNGTALRNHSVTAAVSVSRTVTDLHRQCSKVLPLSHSNWGQ